MCWIEGRNGIGKTLAIRLLELATGTQPYAALPLAWASLRSSLRTVRIDAIDSHGERNLTWTLEPQNWPETPEPVGEWLGSVLSNGHKTSIGDAASKVKVVRFSG